MSEFTVQKIAERHPEPTRRILCLTEATILERDPQTYSVCIDCKCFDVDSHDY